MQSFYDGKPYVSFVGSWDSDEDRYTGHYFDDDKSFYYDYNKGEDCSSREYSGKSKCWSCLEDRSVSKCMERPYRSLEWLVENRPELF